ncbi:MAG: alanine:cation symporter family protein [Clostridia bacterium]|nr:alanine:cation symporter family protein [Clostridia bacterium]
MSLLMSATPILLFCVGFFYIFRLGGFYLLHPLRCVRLLFTGKRSDGISPFRALTVALAGTLGVGNIVGVASALYLGGPGAVLWMLIAALVAMVLKYAEITLALRHRRTLPDGSSTGGAPYYMEDCLKQRGFPRAGRCLAVLFAVLCLVNAVTMGSLLQINAVSGAMEEGFSVPPLVTGVGIALLATVTVLGGARRISALTEKLVPFMTVAFLVVTLAVLYLRRERIPGALAMIGRDALNPVGVGGGLVGFLTARGVRFGVMRGLVSNEAGCGTAPMAHASADTDLPARQGLFGLVEVFVDTVLLCTLTALCILVSDSGPAAFGEDVTRTAQAAFSSVLGGWAGGFFALSIFLFGVATVICWAHYGMTCVDYLLPHGRGRGGGKGCYILLLTASLIVGAVATPSLAWGLADVAISLMTLLNLMVLMALHREVAEETELLEIRNKMGKICISCQQKHPERSQP